MSSPIHPAPPQQASPATSSSGAPTSNITVTLSSPNVPAVSVEISQGHVSIGGEDTSDSHNVRRRVTSSTLNTNSNTNVNEFATPSNELGSSSDTLRSQQRRSNNSSERSSAAAADFSTHVNVSFSTDPAATMSTGRSAGADVSSIFGAPLSGSSAGATAPAFNPLSRIQ